MRLRFFFTLIIWFALLKILTWPITIRMADDVQIPQGSVLAPAGEISRGQLVRQELPAPGSSIRMISIYLATYQRTMRWPLVMHIEAKTADGTWVTVQTHTIDANNILDNSYYSVNFSPPLRVPRTQSLAIALSSDAPAGQAASWWTSPSWIKSGYQLTSNDQPLPGNAVMALQYSRDQGPLIALVPRIWHRVSAFLSAPWQILLGTALLFGGGALISLYLLPTLKVGNSKHKANGTASTN